MRIVYERVEEICPNCLLRLRALVDHDMRVMWFCLFCSCVTVVDSMPYGIVTCAVCGGNQVLFASGRFAAERSARAPAFGLATSSSFRHVLKFIRERHDGYDR